MIECPDCGGELYERRSMSMGRTLEIRCDTCPYKAYWSTADWQEVMEEDRRWTSEE